MSPAPAAARTLSAPPASASGPSPAPRQLARYARLLAESVLPMADWIDAHRPDHGNRATRLRACAAVLAFRPLPGGGHCLAAGTRLCNQPLLCAVCASVQAAKFAHDYARRVAHALGGHPDRRAYLVTLTRRPDPDLLSSVRNLLACSARLHGRGRKDRRAGRGGFSEAARAAGAVRTTEVHWNDASPPGGPHLWTPHDHQVWVCDSAPDPGALSAQWAAVTGGSPDVDVEDFHAYGRGLDPAALAAALAADAENVFWYARKPERLPPDARWDRYAALTRGGRSRSPRLTAAYGCLRGPPPEAPGPTAAGDRDAPARVFEWDDGGYRKRG